MSILINKESRVLCQGITGKAGAFHSSQCLAYGTKLVAGVTPNKGGRYSRTRCRFSIPSPRPCIRPRRCEHDLRSSAVRGRRDSRIGRCGDSSDHCNYRRHPRSGHGSRRPELRARPHCRLIGPNCPGVITPDECKIGIMPGYIHKKGPIGVISRSGTLTYEAVWQLTALGLGQSTCVGLGVIPLSEHHSSTVWNSFRTIPTPRPC